MDLNWLRDFECLGRTLNFTRAAEERNITQSAFSRRIKALESWVGQPLVIRASYPVQLSDAGHQFLPVAKESISRLSEVRQTIRDENLGDRQFVRFSVLHTISVHYLASRIEELAQQIAGLRTRVISDSLSTCCDLLHENNVEFLVCYRHHAIAPTIDETAFARKDLLIDRLIPVAEKNAARAARWQLPGDKTTAIPYLAYERGSFLGMVVENTIGKRRPNCNMIYMDGLVEAIKRRLMAGSGIAWMPETAISQELAQGDLVPVGGPEWEAALYLSAYCKPQALDAVARRVWEAL